MMFKKIRYWSTLKISLFFYICSYFIFSLVAIVLTFFNINIFYDLLIIFLFGFLYILLNLSISYISKPLASEDRKKWKKFIFFSVVIYVFRNIIIFVPIIFSVFFPNIFKWYIDTVLIIYCILLSNFINIYFSYKYTRKKVIV